MSSFPCLVRFVSGSGQARYRLGDRYLEFVAGRCRPNTLRAVAFDLKAFFTVIEKDPLEVVVDRNLYTGQNPAPRQRWPAASLPTSPGTSSPQTLENPESRA